MKTLRLILGDQLNYNHSWFQKVDDDVIYLMAEVKQETNYVRHHIQKITSFFAAMRAFSNWLTSEGHSVKYYELSDPENLHDFNKLIEKIIKKEKIKRFEYQLPDEYRLDEQLKDFCQNLNIETEVFDTEHFYTSRTELEDFFKGKKQYLLESFYRHMRKKHDVLMNGSEPITGKWNYDKENRKKLPKDQQIPAPKSFDNNVDEIVKMIDEKEIDYFGNIDAEKLVWPINRNQSLELLDHFMTDCLPLFGKYQDALTDRDWSLFHSRLSFSLNTKMLSPQEVVDRSIEEWENRKDEISIAQLEGFVRQILGWREFMRGIYWTKMPDYESLNFFDHDNSLPSWYWTGETKMKCMSHAINQSLDHAYAHHIQRLMITGNFALLAGVNPDELDDWYLGIYIDAIQWVEITNTRGMSQFADGGVIGTKPYVSSASYINKMSDYCKLCHYSQSKKTGEKACPFNSLYWQFYERHRDKLRDNHRVGMMYRTWDKMGSDRKTEYLKQAEYYLENIESL
ncbi:cryptochrome/photolyase family protein [Salibacter halophilus]|uniref:Cryptochrome/photolyase family protein n=1 Tax=Salibacter halophilus TaxID=1803916 RepID=A0A6N6M6F2_9FLAO|nr:cryptochrome/photolyase family protein [Salibacter halophilus]KAB1063644.1 cryptochrome/photolyase family protein [Salibacter halophilus]